MGVAARRLAVAALLAGALGGCSVFIGDMQPQPGQLLEDGSLLIGSGIIGDEQWVVVMTRRGDQLCSGVSLGGRNTGGGTCSSAADLAQNVSGMSSSSDGRIITFEGLMSAPATTLRLEGPGLLADYPVVSLAPLGAPGYAFGVVLPELPSFSMTLFDANGNVVERDEMRFR